MAGLQRSDVYMTEVFHLLPLDERCARKPLPLLDASFDAVTWHELFGRNVIALGRAAQMTCTAFNMPHIGVSHLSRRGILVDVASRLTRRQKSWWLPFIGFSVSCERLQAWAE